ncbi:hypothetical protein [Paraburkholderia elongata]|nr:hypothetical protein [Paraburkholderia elongata]
MNAEGINKAALLLMSLSEDRAGGVIDRILLGDAASGIEGLK